MYRHLAQVLLVAPIFVGCGGTNPVQPKDLTAGSAAGITCNASDLADEAMTFVVDWKDGQRSALESAMGKGIAVVKYSCEGAKVLAACRIVGDYGYAGGTRRKKVISMKDAVQAQAQFGGRHIGASFKGQFAQGRSLNLAYTTVGANSTTVTSVDKSMLTGRCKGATHFVYEAEVGAFAVATSSKGEASAFGEVFGQGSASGSTSSGKEAMTSDGQIKACGKASKKDLSATEECEAIVRISLLPIEATGGGKAAKGGVPDLRSCPSGYVFNNDECVSKGSTSSFLCTKDNYKECFEQCKKGHLASCGRFGLMNIQSEEDIRTSGKAFDNFHFEKQSHQIVKNLQKACLLEGEANACISAKNAAWYAMFEKYDQKDLKEPAAEETSREAMAFELAKTGCQGGEGFACAAVSQQITEKDKAYMSPQKILLTVEQACSRSPVACGILGNMNAHTMGTTEWLTLDGITAPNANEAKDAFIRACDGGLADGCYALGFMYMPRAEVQAVMTQLEAEDKSTNGELRGSLRYSDLDPSLHNSGKARAYLKRACAMGKPAFIDGDHEIACGIK